MFPGGGIAEVVRFVKQKVMSDEVRKVDGMGNVGDGALDCFSLDTATSLDYHT